MAGLPLFPGCSLPPRVSRGLSRDSVLVLTPRSTLGVSLCIALTEAGYHVEVVRSGPRALKRKEPYSVLLGDAQVAGLDEVLPALREREPAPAVLIFGPPTHVEKYLDSAASIQGLVVEPFTPRQLRWAVESALEHRGLLRDNRRLKALLPLYELSKGLVSEVGLKQLLDAILELVSHELGAERVSLMLLDETGQELTVRAALGLPEGVVGAARVKVGEGIAGWVARSGQPLLLPQQAEQYPTLKAAMRRAEVASALCLPLVVKGDVIGVINASKKSRGTPFVRADLELLSIIGGQAAIAIENARLFESVKAHQKRAEELLQRSLLVQDEERRRISLEVHDSVAQWLVATYYMVQSCQGRLSPIRLGEVRAELQEVQQSLARSIGELRRIIADLHPVALRELGLVGALRRMTEALSRERMTCHLNISGRPVPLPQVVEMAAYRVAQEALSNVRKHSAATQVSALASFEPEVFALEVSDNGRGFDLGSVTKGERGLVRMGLVGMKERAESLGGTLKVETAEGAGTRVLLRLPLAQTRGADTSSLSSSHRPSTSPSETSEAKVHPTPLPAEG